MECVFQRGEIGDLVAREVGTDDWNWNWKQQTGGRLF